MAVTSPGLSILGHHFASEQDTCSRGGLVRGFGVPPGGGNSILLSDLLRSSKTLEVCVTAPPLCQEGPRILLHSFCFVAVKKKEGVCSVG